MEFIDPLGVGLGVGLDRDDDRDEDGWRMSGVE